GGVADPSRDRRSKTTVASSAAVDSCHRAVSPGFQATCRPELVERPNVTPTSPLNQVVPLATLRVLRHSARPTRARRAPRASPLRGIRGPILTAILTETAFLLTPLVRSSLTNDRAGTDAALDNRRAPRRHVVRARRRADTQLARTIG